MPRPKGSTNKPKNTNNLFVTKFDKQIIGNAVTKENPMGWVNWGVKNDYPNQLLNLYCQSPTHAACINFEVQCVVGEGVDYDAMQIDGSQVFPNYTESWDSFIKNISLDYMLYGSYCVQIIKNKDGKTFSFWHTPLDKVRWTEYDEDGQITSYYICRDWTATGKYPPVLVEAFDMRDDVSKIESGKPYLYVYRQYNPFSEYYTTPNYIGGLKAIQAEIEHINFDLKTSTNSFVPSGMLVLNEVETDEERNAIIKNVQNMFVGTDNANSLMVTFRSNIEENKPEFIPFTTNASNVNLFDSSNQRSVNRILAAHQIPNASLVGLPDMVGSGFASEADKLETAFQLYNKLTGNHNRIAIVKTLNAMFAMNGIDTEIILKPLKFNDFGGEEDRATTVNDVAEVNDGDVDADNVEEKEDGNNNDNNK